MRKLIYIFCILFILELIGAYRNDYHWRWISSQVICLFLASTYFYLRKNKLNLIDYLVLLIYLLTYVSIAVLELKKQNFNFEIVGIAINAIILIIYLFIFLKEPNLLRKGRINIAQWIQVIVPTGFFGIAYSAFILETLPKPIFIAGIVHIILYAIVLVIANFRDVNARSRIFVFSGIILFALAAMVISQNEFVFKSRFGQLVESLCYFLGLLFVWYGMIFREELYSKKTI